MYIHCLYSRIKFFEKPHHWEHFKFAILRWIFGREIFRHKYPIQVHEHIRTDTGHEHSVQQYQPIRTDTGHKYPGQLPKIIPERRTGRSHSLLIPLTLWSVASYLLEGFIYLCQSMSFKWNIQSIYICSYVYIWIVYWLQPLEIPVDTSSYVRATLTHKHDVNAPRGPTYHQNGLVAIPASVSHYFLILTLGQEHRLTKLKSYIWSWTSWRG